MRLPTTNWVTMPFGSTSAPYSSTNKHRGTDFSYLPDDKVYAPFSGRVTVRPHNGSDGNAIYMTNGNQFHGFLHMSSFLVQDGREVVQGQPIGIMGETGLAQGKHLHWAVKVNGVFIDPLTLIKDEQMATTPRNLVINFYTDLLGRNPSETEINTWVPHPADVVYDGIKGSTEYRNISQHDIHYYMAKLAEAKAYVDRAKVALDA